MKRKYCKYCDYAFELNEAGYCKSCTSYPNDPPWKLENIET